MYDESTPDKLNAVKLLLAQGDSAQALSLAQGRETKEVRDPELHLAWADILEELGLVEEVILELHLALRDDPGNAGLYARLAEVYLDAGRPARAAQVWAGVAKRFPAQVEAYQHWGELLRDLGDHERARQVWQEGLKNTGQPIFQSLLQDLESQEAAPAPSLGLEAGEQLVPGRHHLVSFTTLFAGREGVYARQWVSPTGETGYTPVSEPLTLKVAENHLLGNYTIGVYPVRLDNTVNFIAFDFDLAKFAVHKAIASRSAWEGLMRRLHQAACRLVDLGAAHELPVYLEDSGFKGRHAWIFLETPVPAGVAKKCGDLLAARLRPLPVEVTAEVFPKQTAVKRGGLGNLIKLPLGFHKRTGRRAVFVQPDGAPYPQQLEFLLTVAKAPRRAVYALIQKMHHPPALTSPTAAPPPSVEAPPDLPWEETTTAEVAPKVPAPLYQPEQDVQFQHLVHKCPVLAALLEKIDRTSLIGKEETLVLIHTVGHLEHGPEAVNELFQRCLNADPTLFLKSRLRGHPMSCPKIRARIPELTSQVACNCTFDLRGNLYPTPLIHLQSLTPQAAEDALHLDSLKFQHLLQEYLKLKKQLRETQILLTQYENQLAQIFQQAGVDSCATAMGTLRCRKDDDGKLIFVLEI